jgi:N-acetylglucosamine-6-phosphate deacetylase
MSINDKIYKIINARLLLEHEIVENSYLWYQNGKIIHPQNLFFSARRDADEIIDAKGLLVVPGFIDTQINGAYGIDFADSEEPVEVLKQNINKVAKGLLQYGCTAFCPTVVSSPAEVYEKVKKNILRWGARGLISGFFFSSLLYATGFTIIKSS